MSVSKSLPVRGMQFQKLGFSCQKSGSTPGYDSLPLCFLGDLTVSV